MNKMVRNIVEDTCPQCSGSGYTSKPFSYNPQGEKVYGEKQKCTKCGGTGKSPILFTEQQVSEEK